MKRRYVNGWSRSKVVAIGACTRVAPSTSLLAMLWTVLSGCSLELEPTYIDAYSSNSERIGDAESGLGGLRDPVRVHAILAATTDGAEAPWVTPDEIRNALKLASDVYAPADILFTFDPKSDITHINNTLLAHDCTLSPNANMNSPKDKEPDCDGIINNNERNKVAQNYPGKLVIYFVSGDRPRYDESKQKWVYGPRTFAWSNGDDSFVAMNQGDPGLLIAHEIGHYLHLPHTFWYTPSTVNEARQNIRDYVASHNLPKDKGINIFEGDGIPDTSPDPGPALFTDAGLDPCKPAQGTLNLFVSFPDNTSYVYKFSPDRENIMNYWNKTCLGLSADLSTGQASVVRAAIETQNRKHLLDPKVLYSAVWEPKGTGETRAIGWALDDFATRFNKELASGRHLVHMQAYDIGGNQIRYDGVWDLGNAGQTRALSWAFDDFVTRNKQELAQGRHIVHVQAYNIGNNQVRWDGVWNSGGTGQSWVLGWAFSHFWTRFNQEIANGKHLTHMQAYDTGGGQMRWDGVWEPGNTGQSWVMGWSIYDFAAKFNQEIASGRHLVHMQAYDTGGGQMRWDGVWESGARGNTRAIGWAFNDFVLRNEAEVAKAKRLVHLQAYDTGGGQVRYDGVWADGNPGQTQLLSESIGPFAERFNQELAKGRHIVLMQAHTGR